MAKLEDAIQRGTRVAQPTPSATAIGILYHVTDEGVTERWSGVAWEDYSGGPGVIAYVIDGGGVAITTGVKGFLEVPFACTITGWSLLADQAGSIVIDVWKDTYANFPPTIADTIAGSEKPTLSAVQKNQDLTLTTWTTAVTAWDILAFNVDSAATLTRVTLSIHIER